MSRLVLTGAACFVVVFLGAMAFIHVALTHMPASP